MKIGVLHDERGKIIALSKVGDLQAAGSEFTRVGMLPGKGQQVREIELGGEHEGKSLLELHNECHVHLATSKLVKKS
jgi:hypothetical protein